MIKKFDLEFKRLDKTFELDYGEVHKASDGGFEKGYEQGYKEGENDGYSKGHADGLSQRTYETWTITLKDGSIVEKEVALL